MTKTRLLILVVCVLVSWAAWSIFDSEGSTQQPLDLTAPGVVPPTHESQGASSAEKIPSTVATKRINTYSLPPDPGPEGMATLLGIDSNQNGIRDDTERFIMQNYGDSERAREALFDYARVDQQWLSVATKADALQAVGKLHDAMDCVRFAMGDAMSSNGIDKWIQATREVELLKFNTPERARASQRTDELLAWHGSDSRDADGSTCSFDPKTIKN